MKTPYRLSAHWRKSSRSANAGGQCVEVASTGGNVLLRDSKLSTVGDFPQLSVASTEWVQLMQDIKIDH
ncbi:uncharacterized protein DUF397 [Stackebrandtia endophytica]|uniref:Uncharacterized protein DUF397 n=1 Tax=Stackebrandtia endophytica TaxID=1496996 RepID=A0A543AV17_9ACTN|nr:DUF397 domain-containing protein [Stackebrandtia endophytica]TQL76426.1 uncharacterized protein DUF397 [Stackebrandtia endophytica]